MHYVQKLVSTCTRTRLWEINYIFNHFRLKVFIKVTIFWILYPG